MTDVEIKVVTVTKRVEEKGADGEVWVDEYTVYAVREPGWDYYQVKDGVRQDSLRVSGDQQWRVGETTLYVSSKQGALDYIELLGKIVKEYEAAEETE